MDVHRGGVGQVPLKSTGHTAPLRDGPQYCRPQNQWAPDQEVEKWEKEITDIFSGDHQDHKFEEADILENSKDFPTHSGIQTPSLNEAIGKPQEMSERRDEQQSLSQNLLSQDNQQPLIRKESTEKEVIKPSILEDREEFPSLGTKLNEMGEDKQLFGKSAEESKFLKNDQMEGQAELNQNEKLPRHGVPLEEFIDQDNCGKPHQNTEGKVAEHRSETAPGTGVHIGEALKPQISKRQGEEPDLTPPKEADKETEETKEVKGVVEEVKHAVEVVGAKIAHGAHEVKEMLSDAVHHLTATTEANDSASKATEETGYNTCA